MACQHVTLPSGARAIVCGTAPRKRCGCSRWATLLCDWKMPGGGTCDTPLCSVCTTSPAQGKDLCRRHAQAFEEWKAAKA
ncbi:hypothetical protein [Sphingomonas aquatilis]|uniref:hypothetical protein n=1 Tax=Sphingomonas aquatilis TaxID=93063 RepID=UPI0023F85484|nr:hypothetical protein [Sphingomonas aquatilis]MCI4653088.1 hypothetical protein [Sphingomonas aquatilis]